jgi:hypothetical protein
MDDLRIELMRLPLRPFDEAAARGPGIELQQKIAAAKIAREELLHVALRRPPFLSVLCRV